MDEGITFQIHRNVAQKRRDEKKRIRALTYGVSDLRDVKKVSKTIAIKAKQRGNSCVSIGYKTASGCSYFHMVSHTGQKPYHCDCGTSFTRKDSFQKHKKKGCTNKAIGRKIGIKSFVNQGKTDETKPTSTSSLKVSTSLKSEDVSLKSEIVALKSEIVALKSEIVALKSENSALKSEYAILKGENAAPKVGALSLETEPVKTVLRNITNEDGRNIKRKLIQQQLPFGPNKKVKKRGQEN